MFRDPNLNGVSQVFTGLYFQLGLLAWAIGLGSILTTFINLPDRARGHRGFLIYLCSLTAFLMLDDGFRLHESVFPYLSLSEHVT